MSENCDYRSGDNDSSGTAFGIETDEDVLRNMDMEEKGTVDNHWTNNDDGATSNDDQESGDGSNATSYAAQQNDNFANTASDAAPETDETAVGSSMGNADEQYNGRFVSKFVNAG